MFIVTWIDLGQFHNADFFHENDAIDYFNTLKTRLGPHVKSIICNTTNQKELRTYIDWLQVSYKKAIDIIRREREENKSIRDELNQINKERYKS